MMARIVRLILPNTASFPARVQVSSAPITKYDLLGLLRCAGLRVAVEIVPDETVQMDRSLDSSRFRALTGLRPSVVARDDRAKWRPMRPRMSEWRALVSASEAVRNRRERHDDV